MGKTTTINYNFEMGDINATLDEQRGYGNGNAVKIDTQMKATAEAAEAAQSDTDDLAEIVSTIKQNTAHEFFSGVQSGSTRQVYADYAKICRIGDSAPPYCPETSLKAGVIAINAQVRFANLKVSDLAGNLIWTENFSGTTVGQFPSDWTQHCTTASYEDFAVVADATEPSGSGKCLEYPSADSGALWVEAWKTADVLPSDGNYVYEMDVKIVDGTYGFNGPIVCVVPNTSQERAPGCMCWGEEKSYLSYFRLRPEGGFFHDELIYERELPLAGNVWHHMKLFVDHHYNLIPCSEIGETGQLTRRRGQSYANTQRLLDTRLRDGVIGKGSISNLWIALGSFGASATIKIITDGVTRVDNVDLKQFCFCGLVPTTEGYMTRYQGVDRPDVSWWRALHIPFEEYAIVEITNTSSVYLDIFEQLEYKIGHHNAPYPNYECLYAENNAVAEFAWQTLAEVTGKAGKLQSVYIEEEGAVNMTFLEGNLRIWVDGEVVWESSGTEDIPFSSYYFDQGVKRGDFYGIVHATTDAAPYKFAFYRYFIQNTILFSASIKIEIQNGQFFRSGSQGAIAIRSAVEIYTE